MIGQENAYRLVDHRGVAGSQFSAYTWQSDGPLPAGWEDGPYIGLRVWFDGKLPDYLNPIVENKTIFIIGDTVDYVRPTQAGAAAAAGEGKAQ
jgi:hypothetical protein